MFTQTKKIYQVVNEIELPDDVSVRLGNTRLGMRNPEDYRQKLLGMIQDQIRSTKESLGAAGNVTIRGLEGAVLVSQKDDSDVVLFIDYEIEISMKKLEPMRCS